MATISPSFSKEIWAELYPRIDSNPPLKWGLLAFAIFFASLVWVNFPGTDGIRAFCALVVSIMIAHSCSLAVRGHFCGRFGHTRTALFFLLSISIQFANASFLVPSSWDSIRRLGQLLAGVIGLIGVFTLVPKGCRKLGAMVLFFVHFFGLTSITIPGCDQSFLTRQSQVRFYKKLQRFLHLGDQYKYFAQGNNAWPLLWFRVDYHDQSNSWHRVPDSSHSISTIGYSRERSIGCSGDFFISHNHAEVIGYNSEHQRNIAASEHVPQIPPLPVKSAEFQTNHSYLISKPYGEKNLSSYARHIANLKSKSATGSAPKSVRIYLVFHRVMTPKEMAEGSLPDEPRFYLPYFLGDYSPRGELLHPDDRLIGYPLPIYPKVDAPYAKPGEVDLSKVDYFFLHSGLDLFKEHP